MFSPPQSPKQDTKWLNKPQKNGVQLSRLYAVFYYSENRFISSYFYLKSVLAGRANGCVLPFFARKTNRCAAFRAFFVDILLTVAETPLLTWGEYEITETSVPENYLDEVSQTVDAKRGRNVEKYRTRYEEATRLYGYINT